MASIGEQLAIDGGIETVTDLFTYGRHFGYFTRQSQCDGTLRYGYWCVACDASERNVYSALRVERMALSHASFSIAPIRRKQAA